jgi:hypothetical protein
MNYQDVMVNGENLSVPLWQCALCGAEGEAATAGAGGIALLDHIRGAHPDKPIALPGEGN